MLSKYRFLFVVLLITTTFPSLAQENAENAAQPTAQKPLWYEEFFIETSALYYSAPDWLGEMTKPEFGFRAAIGYEYGDFMEGTFLSKLGGSLLFALESGCIFTKANSPLIKEGSIVPLVLKFGYLQPLYKNFGIQADINFGFAFSQVSRYETASDIINNKTKTDNSTGFLGGMRLYAALSPLEYLKIYAGGGVDFIFEKSEPIPLPVIEIGISLKPFIAARGFIERREKLRNETVDNENIIFVR